MANPAFYGSPDEDAIMEDYEDSKKQLERVMENWETAQAKLEEFDRG